MVADLGRSIRYQSWFREDGDFYSVQHPTLVNGYQPTDITRQGAFTMSARQVGIQNVLDVRNVDARSLADSSPVQNYYAARRVSDDSSSDRATRRATS